LEIYTGRAVHSCTAWLCFQKAGVTNDIKFDLLHHMHALLLAFIAMRQDAHATQRPCTPDHEPGC